MEEKEKEIERLKRNNNKLQKENIQMKADQRKGGRVVPVPYTAPTLGHKKIASIYGEKKPLNPLSSNSKKKTFNPVT